MRRGLMAWSRDEIGAAVFEQRVAALVAGMGARAWDCVLAYTDLTRPAAVSALTHFIPYWSNGVLVVSPSTGATLVTTLSRRVADWMHSTARLDGLVNTLDLGTGVAECLPKANGAVMRVGVVELASLPCSVAAVAISTAAMMTWVSTAPKAVSSRAAGWSSTVSFFSTTEDCW